MKMNSYKGNSPSTAGLASRDNLYQAPSYEQALAYHKYLTT